MNRICIPDWEYQERIKKASKLVQKKGLDAMLVVSTESDYANARYFSGFWPLFERAGVLIGASGKAVLLVGPESAIFAKDFGKIDKVMVLKEFRESADPSYPELIPDTFKDAFNYVGVTTENAKIGLGSYVECTLPIMDGLKNAFPKAEISICSDIMVELRSIKSENELACIKEEETTIEIPTKSSLSNAPISFLGVKITAMPYNCSFFNIGIMILVVEFNNGIEAPSCSFKQAWIEFSPAYNSSIRVFE